MCQTELQPEEVDTANVIQADQTVFIFFFFYLMKTRRRE